MKHPRLPSRQQARQRLRAGAYLLPSLFTIGNMMLGFFAILLGLRALARGGAEAVDLLRNAAALIMLGGILDGLDGRIARLTKTESDFGREFDSLADMLTFGAAPALVAHTWGLHLLGRTGWVVPFFFLLCTTTRLARFNVQTKSTDSRFFVGMPCPAAAGAVASIIFVVPDSTWASWLPQGMLAALVGLGCLMVTTFRYPSFKNLDLRRRWSYRALLPLAAGLLVMVVEPRAFFLAAAVVYTLWGPIAWISGRLRRSNPPPTELESVETP